MATDLGQQQVRDLEKRVRSGTASADERTDFVHAAGELGMKEMIPLLWELLGDEHEEVRYYVLQSLVLDLGQKDLDTVERCWNLLATDPDESVRSMAAGCLGSIFFGSHDHRVFSQMRRIVEDPGQPLLAREAAYTALFGIPGLPPKQWPGFEPPWNAFREQDIDRKKIDDLERLLRAEGGSQ